MRFGLSTILFSGKIEKAEDVLKHLEFFPFVEVIEVEYRFPEEILPSFIKLVKKSPYKVYSVHNFLPLPKERGPLGSISEPLNLASLDNDERKLALKYTMRSIDNLLEMEGEVLVVHLGKTPMENPKKDLFKLFDEERWEDIKELSKSILEERKKYKKSLDRALLSLEEIAERADKEGIKIGVENRYYINEIPFDFEFEVIFEKLEGAPIGYWHDFGHGEVLERFYLQKHISLLERFGSNLIGVHMHDIKGYEDHYPIGMGDLDFGRFVDFIREKTIIYEINPKHSFEEVLRGHERLLEYFGDR